MLTILQLSSSSPVSVAIFYIADPKSLKDLSPPPTFLLSPAPFIQLATSSGMSHRPIALTKSKIIFSLSNLSPPSPSQFYCLLPKPNTSGSCQAHIPHPLPISPQSPCATFPTVVRSPNFSFICLVKYRLLGTDCVCHAQITRALAVMEQAESLQRAYSLVG